MSRAGLNLPAQSEMLLDEATVAAGFDALATALQPQVAAAGQTLLLAIMNGGLYPMMQLAQRLHGDFLLDYCHASRYFDASEGGDVQWLRKPPAAVAGRSVLLIDDIFDAGITLAAVADACRAAGAVKVSTVVQVVKDRPRSIAVPEPDFTTGLVVPDVYVFGCGMDLAGHWRHLPAIFGVMDGSGRA